MTARKLEFCVVATAVDVDFAMTISTVRDSHNVWCGEYYDHANWYRLLVARALSRKWDSSELSARCEMQLFIKIWCFKPLILCFRQVHHYDLPSLYSWLPDPDSLFIWLLIRMSIYIHIYISIFFVVDSTFSDKRFLVDWVPTWCILMGSTSYIDYWMKCHSRIFPATTVKDNGICWHAMAWRSGDGPTTKNVTWCTGKRLLRIFGPHSPAHIYGRGNHSVLCTPPISIVWHEKATTRKEHQCLHFKGFQYLSRYETSFQVIWKPVPVKYLLVICSFVHFWRSFRISTLPTSPLFLVAIKESPPKVKS